MSEAIAIGLARQQRERVARLICMGYYTGESDFVRNAVMSKLAEFEFVRETSVTRAKDEVLRYVTERPNTYADEIAAALDLDIETALAAIDELIKDRKAVA